eukprot:1034129-Alexandrium_andersonii.AAC.1
MRASAACAGSRVTPAMPAIEPPTRPAQNIPPDTHQRHACQTHRVNGTLGGGVACVHDHASGPLKTPRRQP